MLLLLIAAVWVLGLFLVAVLCWAARLGDAVDVIAEGGPTAARPRRAATPGPRTSPRLAA